MRVDTLMPIFVNVEIMAEVALSALRAPCEIVAAGLIRQDGTQFLQNQSATYFAR